ncbi:sugar kinase [Chelonobacter oris]|uniref:Sugar kinase n=1 Tax=Chelonobacter oris TaxID=505317 RepID=A0A0A3BDF2_9PAST|nr:sugar kinase [Chelonobacter oris]KGQ71574.1 sugar kinase [Chelonobacter oris]
MSQKVLTIGEILVEIVATTKGNGFLEIQPFIGPFPSGAPAIFIDQVGKLGTPCAMISRVGDDDFGRLNLNRLAADHVDISGIVMAKGETTGSAFIRYREDGSRKFVFNIANSACGKLEENSEIEQLLQQCRHLHLMGTALSSPGLNKMALKAIQAIKSHGGTVSFDPNLRAEMMTPTLHADLDAVLAQTDLFLPSGDELFLFTRAKDEHTAINELLNRGIREIVLKRGHQGASYFAEGKRFDVAAHSVTELDPTGAGDSFGGAFVSFWLNGSSPQEALYYANIAGARAVTFLGPMEGTSTRVELEQFLNVAK